MFTVGPFLPAFRTIPLGRTFLCEKNIGILRSSFRAQSIGENAAHLASLAWPRDQSTFVDGTAGVSLIALVDHFIRPTDQARQGETRAQTLGRTV